MVALTSQVQGSINMSGNAVHVSRSTFFKRIGIGLFAGVLALTMVLSDAQARRLGGGRSMGTQSQPVQRSVAPAAVPPAAPAAARPTPSAAPAPAPQPARSRWMGALGGLAAGLGIAALLSHFGLAGAFAGMLSNLIVIALVAFVVIWLARMLMRRFGPPQQGLAATAALGARGNEAALQPGHSATAANAATNPATSAGLAAASVAAGSSVASNANFTVPADFDTEALLREAKVSFIRLQAAWDAGDMNDIDRITTPEMYANVKLDLNDRGGAGNRTDVVKLDAKLVGLERVDAQWLASVHFSGLIRETEGAAAEPFEEVWNLTRNIGRTDGWLLAGIQQLN
jgi:predicted lipid-binding transport protein (Tim44 family)